MGLPSPFSGFLFNLKELKAFRKPLSPQEVRLEGEAPVMGHMGHILLCMISHGYHEAECPKSLSLTTVSRQQVFCRQNPMYPLGGPSSLRRKIKSGFHPD